MNKIIFVICGKDSHVKRIPFCIKSIKYIYHNNVDIGISTFGSKKLPPSIILKEFSKENNYIFYDSPRQDYTPLNREQHCCEIIGMLDISKYFYELGYKQVYLMHNDMFIFRDFVGKYEKNMVNNWSFIVPFINIDPSPLKYEEALKFSGFELRKKPARLSQTIIIFNKLFIQDCYKKYNNGKTMWNNYFKKDCMFGDLGLFDIAKNFIGYTAKPITDEIQISLRFFKGNMEKEIINNKNICMAHNPVTYKLLKDKFKYILDIIYEK